MRKITAMLITAVMLLSVTACSLKSGGEMVYKHFEDTQILKDHLKDSEDLDWVTDCEYVEYAYQNYERGIPANFGPSEPGFYGIIRITADKAEELNETYEWTECDTQFLTDELGFDEFEDSTWYSNPEFKGSLFKAVNTLDVCFNGEDTIYFSIHEI